MTDSAKGPLIKGGLFRGMRRLRTPPDPPLDTDREPVLFDDDDAEDPTLIS